MVKPTHEVCVPCCLQAETTRRYFLHKARTPPSDEEDSLLFSHAVQPALTGPAVTDFCAESVTMTKLATSSGILHDLAELVKFCEIHKILDSWQN